MTDMADTGGDQSGEELDENVPESYPPDRPLAVFDEGVTGLEQLGGESFSDRDDRTEPEVWEGGGRSDEPGPVLLGDEDVDAVDDEKDLVASDAGEADTGALPDDDQVTGDGTTRDYATELEGAVSAEEEAVHVVDEPPGATE